MVHPNKADSVKGNNAKMRRMTAHYGAADPAMRKSASVDADAQEGPQEALGFGAEGDAPSANAGRKSRKKTTPVNPVATYAAGGSVIARAHGGKTKGKKAGTHVNIMIGHPGAGAMPGNTVPPPVVPPGLAPPPGGPPMSPPGGPMGGLPMGGPGGPMAGPPGGPPRPLMGPPGAMPPGMMPPRKRGGRVHDDAAEDRAMIKGMVKPEALKRRAAGGRLTKHHMTAGAVTGEGRLEKIGKKPHNAGKLQKV